ncbi:deoxyribodipyrimidine photolyase-related protein [Roseibium hamelinense]|uniref:Deoxyribodipyrimidine photolyase-related protein n=2 Tax=Roseibium hamelinense TaxID=150831 RepID=A0A562T3C9_9HYPH|nr:deoxyribodipyrimidine photolyase-related protein [Roseibium hamelinense]
MMEVVEEATHVRHHKKKIAFIFSAMRHFARELSEKGWAVHYIKLEDSDNAGSFSGEVLRQCKILKPERLGVTEPSEWRVLEDVKTWQSDLGIPVDIFTDTRFLCPLPKFTSWAKGRKQLRMEYFYRDMRRQTGLLMNDDGKPGEPIGGKWNFDTENRKPAKADLFMPEPKRFEPDQVTQEVLDLVNNRFGHHFGDLEPFWFGVTTQQAHEAFEHFLQTALPHFGDYQDAMLKGEKFLYHAVTSLYLNIGLLDPLEMCSAVEEAYKAGDVPLNAAEGFIRQIIGWREYVRGIYWLKMPDYASGNFLNATRDLPEFYWTGDTDMACLKAAIKQTREEAYAHHIQRLMVTGNFAMLIGVDPKQVHEWYLTVYADAFEWVEMPNTIGMSQFADGGLLGSKPYASGGNYINKMSDYCGDCAYKVSKKTEPDACPFNALYWTFLARNETKLKGNPRLAQMYATWSRMSAQKQTAYLNASEKFLASVYPSE